MRVMYRGTSGHRCAELGKPLVRGRIYTVGHSLGKRLTATALFVEYKTPVVEHATADERSHSGT